MVDKKNQPSVPTWRSSNGGGEDSVLALFPVVLRPPSLPLQSKLKTATCIAKELSAVRDYTVL